MPSKLAVTLDVEPATQAPDLTVGILGAGHAGTALAAWFTSRQIPTMIWAPKDHSGSLLGINAHNGVIIAEGIIDGAFKVTTCDDLRTAVRSARLLMIVTRADVHDSFVKELEKFNDELSDKDILVVCGYGFAMNYEKRLRFKRILETDNSPATSKIEDKENAKVNVKEMQAAFGLSCFPIHQNDAGIIDLPDDVKTTFVQLFTARITPIPPLRALFFSNYITHAVAATLNIGRLRDPANSLTEKAERWLTELEEGSPIEKVFFFYSQGSNTYVCRVQEQVDNERRAVAAACGLHLDSILQECNHEGNTDYTTLREFCLAPTPHNVHHACPDNIRHRYFSEELRSIKFIAAIADIVKVDIPLTWAFINIIQAARGNTALDSAECNTISTLTRNDLVRFGAAYGT